MNSPTLESLGLAPQPPFPSLRIKFRTSPAPSPSPPPSSAASALFLRLPFHHGSASFVSGNSVRYNCNAAKWADRLSNDLYVAGGSHDPSPDDVPEVVLSTYNVNRNGKPNGAFASSFPALAERTVALPLDYYQVLGADTHFLADAIVRAYESRIKNLPREGFSQDALISRQEILKAACETLADPDLRGEYNEGLLTDANGTIMVDVPLSKVPGALCLLQEIGEMEVVLKVGGDLLRERLGKFFQRDIVLVMALAFVELSREAMADTPPGIVRGCEFLERSLKLLQEEGGSSLAPALQEQIDETLHQLKPRCIIELLAFPLDEKHRGKREEGLQGLRSILWAVGEGGAFAHIPGYTRNEYMKEAFTHLTAAEQVALFTATPITIPAESSEVYSVALAHVAEGFVAKKPHLVQEADNLFLQLQQINASTPSFVVGGSHSSTDQQLDFAFERAMCQLLLGELDDCRAWLGLDDTNSPYREPAVTDFVIANSSGIEEGDYLPGLCKLLESWLREVVYPSFRETGQLQVKLRDYYDDPGVLSYLEKLEKGDSPLEAAAAIVQLGAGAGAALDSMKETLQKVFPLGRVGTGHQRDVADSIPETANIRYQLQKEYFLQSDAPNLVDVASKNGANIISKDNIALASDTGHDRKSGISVVQFASAVAVIGALGFISWKTNFRKVNPVVGAKQSMVSKVEGRAMNAMNHVELAPKMDARLAEQLVKKWQTTKAQALGEDHAVEKLSEVLDGQMLKSWTERAKDVCKNGWYWEYKVAEFTIESVTISTDGKKAIVEATLGEAANLHDGNNRDIIDSYESSYTTRYELAVTDNRWKINTGAVLQS